MHQGNLFVNPYLGYTWWDQETDGEFMYPKEQHDPTDAELVRSTMVNPEAAAARGVLRPFAQRVSAMCGRVRNPGSAAAAGVYRYNHLGLLKSTETA